MGEPKKNYPLFGTGTGKHTYHFRSLGWEQEINSIIIKIWDRNKNLKRTLKYSFATNVVWFMRQKNFKKLSNFKYNCQLKLKISKSKILKNM